MLLHLSFLSAILADEQRWVAWAHCALVDARSLENLWQILRMNRLWPGQIPMQSLHNSAFCRKHFSTSRISPADHLVRLNWTWDLRGGVAKICFGANFSSRAAQSFGWYRPLETDNRAPNNLLFATHWTYKAYFVQKYLKLHDGKKETIGHTNESCCARMVGHSLEKSHEEAAKKNHVINWFKAELWALYRHAKRPELALKIPSEDQAYLEKN